MGVGVGGSLGKQPLVGPCVYGRCCGVWRVVGIEGNNQETRGKGKSVTGSEGERLGESVERERCEAEGEIKKPNNG